MSSAAARRIAPDGFSVSAAMCASIHGGIHGIRASDDPGVPGRCQFSFVRDPNGNWIELVQFAADEPLPPPPWPNPSMEEFMAFRDHGTPA